MNKFLKRTLTFGLLLTMATGATSCDIIQQFLPNSSTDQPTSSSSSDDTLTLTGVDKVVAEARAETDALIEEIRSAPNMDIPASATVYYVSEYGDDSNDGLSEDSAWLTLEKVNATKLAKGSYVCFRRGGLWRGQLVAQEGVTYTAYGEGDKPMFYASPENGADASKWVKTEYENVWRYTTAFDLDVGCIIFNDGEATGDKMVIWGTALDNDWTYPYPSEELAALDYYNATTFEPWYGLSSMDEDLQFYHNCDGKLFEGDINDKYVYLYSEKNPGERFDSIEFNIQQHVILVNYIKDVTLDNLCVKYTGAHGISAVDVENFTCSNLEVGYIGGSYMEEHTLTSCTRYGNGIQVWEYCDGWVCENNYVYQCYDTGITPQGQLGTAVSPKNQHNITISDNVIEYCNWSVEYWLDWSDEVVQTYKNFLIEDNYMWYAGEGICDTRRDREKAAHIRTWATKGNRNWSEDIVINNNVMIDSVDFTIFLVWSGKMSEEVSAKCAPLLENNVFVADKDADAVIEHYVWEKGYGGTKIPMSESEEFINEFGSGNECWIRE